MLVYTYSEARQKLARVLDEAESQGKVLIRRKDGRTFALVPEPGTISLLGLARIMGETAPLLMIGMVAFIVDVPKGFTDPSTVLPVQVYLWADSPERAFVERTSGAIMVLLGFLLVMNAAAVWLRSRFERRW